MLYAKKSAALSNRAYAVPPGRPFLAVLAEAMLRGNLPVAGGKAPSPFELADCTLLVPTRRDIGALQAAFLKAAGSSALLLPKIKLISDGSDDLATLADAPDGEAQAQGSISKIERELALTKLVLAWSERAAEAGSGSRTAGQAVKLAKELARLMDDVEIEDVSLANIASLAPDDLSEHWSQTLDFLKIVTEHWPAHLAERGLLSPAARRKQLMLAEAARLARSPPRAPVIVAGVTGTVPAATELMRSVMGLELGALLLPPIDRTLDDESWNAIVPAHPEHPQFGLKKLLDALGLSRKEVVDLPGGDASDQQRARWSLACEAMRPAGTTERWQFFTTNTGRQQIAKGLPGLAILEAGSAEEEAEAVALILREVAQTPGRTAALISPDRSLARRVSVRLASWGLDVEDAGGQAFGKTATGAFLDLIIEAAAQRFAPEVLAALLKHPLCRLGMPAARFDQGRRALELAVLRAPCITEGLAALVDGLDRAQHASGVATRQHRAVRRLGQADWKAARDLLERLGKAFAPLEELFVRSKKSSLRALVHAHIAAAEAVAAEDVGNTAGSRLWETNAEETAKLLAGILDPSAPFLPEMRARDYPEFYRSLIAERLVRGRVPSHPRLFIWGPLEARLQQPDIVILGSLNEGTWPQASTPGPWLNRQMRQQLGLPAPEQRIGQAAHDFASFLCADRVYLTRAAKVGGVPTVPSRWLLRIQALLRSAGQPAVTDRPWLQWAQAKNAMSAPARPVSAPEPCPPVTMRPRQLSVTTIEKWIANPYAIFAQRILGLEPLPELGAEPGAALRGQVVHAALSRFAERYPDQLPDDPAKELTAFAQDAFAELTGSPRVAAFWVARFARFAEWFAATEADRRSGVHRTLAEVDGKLVLTGPAGAFTLTARADRLDVAGSGLVITDYKTAASLDWLASRAKTGEAPQLLLEAAIAAEGGFAGIKQKQVEQLRYISASGGEPSGQECLLKIEDIPGAARLARAGLERLIAHYDQEATPYRALRRSRFRYTYDDYAHLARVAEWAVETGEEAEA